MDKLDVTKADLHEGTVIEAKKKQEYKFLGSQKRPHKGMKLYALDLKEEHIYEVKMTKTDVQINIKQPNQPQQKYRAEINPEHVMVWAVNMRTATKKFLKMKFRV